MLEANNIHKAYNIGNKRIQVLNGIGLKIEKKEFIAIIGNSGAGKSTLLHILGGLDAPDQGRVVFEDRDIYKLSDPLLAAMRNSRIGFVFQFYHLLSEFTVLENVLMPVLIRGQGTPACRTGKGERGQFKEEASGLLEKVGLSNRIAHFPSQLSGGEKQRVAIARALINKPALLFCDEPTGNLDSKTGDEIILLIKKINTENQMAVVLVTHNLEMAKLTDRIYHLRDGILEA